MRGKKIFIIVFMTFILTFSTFFICMAQGVQNVTPATAKYNRFLVADLGLTGGGGKRNNIFNVEFQPNVSALFYSLYIEVVRLSDGKLLSSGETDAHQYDITFSGQIFSNYEIKEKLGGKFSISDDAKDLEKKVLTTGAFPEGNFEIRFRLKQGGSFVGVGGKMTIIIDSPYLIPIRPVDTSVTRSLLKFSWRSNLDPMEFRIYDDPRGKREIISGRLPRKNVGQNLDGSSFASDLAVGELYYWQVNGYMNTSHGREFVRGPLNLFLFLEDGSSLRDLGLTEDQKQAILDELVIILKDLISRGASRSILGYDIQRIVLDNSLVTWEEVMAILALIREGKVNVSAIYFR